MSLTLNNNLSKTELVSIMTDLPNLKQKNKKISLEIYRSIFKKNSNRDLWGIDRMDDKERKNVDKNKIYECLKNTSLCYYGDSCTNKTCNYSHSKKDLVPKKCFFDESCYKENCPYIHSSRKVSDNVSTSNDEHKSDDVVLPINDECSCDVVLPINDECSCDVVLPINDECSCDVVLPINDECSCDDTNKCKSDVKPLIPSVLLSKNNAWNKPLVSKSEEKKSDHDSNISSSEDYLINLIKASFRTEQTKKTFVTQFTQFIQTYPDNHQQQYQIYYKTKMCNSIEKNITCTYRDKCSFAHSTSEISKKQCNYGSNCRNKNTCIFAH